VAVGSQSNTVPLIYQNAASAPKAVTPAAVLAGPVTTTATPAAAQTMRMPAPLDAAAVDQFFVAVGKTGMSLFSVGHSSPTHEPAAIGDLDVLAAEMWSMDRA
jgi:hypothetical protein